jgi:hypothetical protein
VRSLSVSNDLLAPASDQTNKNVTHIRLLFPWGRASVLSTYGTYYFRLSVGVCSGKDLPIFYARRILYAHAVRVLRWCHGIDDYWQRDQPPVLRYVGN